MMVSMAMRMKARKAKALKPVWGGQLADRASEVELATAAGKLLEVKKEEDEEERKEKEVEGNKDSKWWKADIYVEAAMVRMVVDVTGKNQDNGVEGRLCATIGDVCILFVRILKFCELGDYHHGRYQNKITWDFILPWSKAVHDLVKKIESVLFQSSL